MRRCRTYPLCPPEGCWSASCPVGEEHDEGPPTLDEHFLMQDENARAEVTDPDHEGSL